MPSPTPSAPSAAPYAHVERAWLARLAPQLSPGALLLLILIRSYVDGRTAGSYAVSRRELGAALGLGERQVSRYVSELCDADLIRVQQDRYMVTNQPQLGSRAGRNRYVVAAWRDPAGQICHPGGTQQDRSVTLASDENAGSAVGPAGQICLPSDDGRLCNSDDPPSPAATLPGFASDWLTREAEAYATEQGQQVTPTPLPEREAREQWAQLSEDEREAYHEHAYDDAALDAQGAPGAVVRTTTDDEAVHAYAVAHGTVDPAQRRQVEARARAEVWRWWRAPGVVPLARACDEACRLGLVPRNAGQSRVKVREAMMAAALRGPVPEGK